MITYFAIYAVVWWVVFFIVLPIGQQREEHPQLGHATSAPKNPMLWRKSAIVTVVSLIIVLFYAYAQTHDWFAFLHLRPS